ncbi:MAG: hypothetical protein RH862_08500 [Leptospiraceae bacterium]
MKLKTKVTLLTTTTFLLGTIGLSSAFYVQYAAVIESRIKRQLTQAATVVKSTINQSGMMDLYEEDARQTEYYSDQPKKTFRNQGCIWNEVCLCNGCSGPGRFYISI